MTPTILWVLFFFVIQVGLRTYPSGYAPREEAAFVGLKAYRNSKDVFFHRTSNVAVIGGLFADSMVAIDIDRSEDVRVDGAVIIGESESYRMLMNSKRLDKFVCYSPHIGIELHTWKNDHNKDNIVIENVRFSGFSHIPCSDAVPFSVDDTVSNAKTFERVQNDFPQPHLYISPPADQNKSI